MSSEPGTPISPMPCSPTDFLNKAAFENEANSQENTETQQGSSSCSEIKPSQLQQFKNTETLVPIQQITNSCSEIKSSQQINAQYQKPGPPVPEGFSLQEGKVIAGGLKIIEGFLTNQTEKQFGGKGNKKPLPKHIVEVDINHLKQLSNSIFFTGEISELVVKAMLFGYDKITKEPEYLAELDTKQVVKCGENTFRAVFDKLVVTKSSHYHGQKLFLKFQLMDNKEEVLGVVNSGEFATITKRGVEKRNIQKAIQKKSEEESVEQPEPVITEIKPNHGIISGGQLVKIFGENFDSSIHISSVVVKFGENISPETHWSNNALICEIPAQSTPGDVTVKISFDSGRTFVESPEKFWYVDISPTGCQRLAQHLMKCWKPTDKIRKQQKQIRTKTKNVLMKQPCQWYQHFSNIIGSLPDPQKQTSPKLESTKKT